MFSYDSDFSPPAPVLEITVHHPKTAGLETGVRAQLDPGSDIVSARRHAQRAARNEADFQLCQPTSSESRVRGVVGVRVFPVRAVSRVLLKNASPVGNPQLVEGLPVRRLTP